MKWRDECLKYRPSSLPRPLPLLDFNVWLSAVVFCPIENGFINRKTYKENAKSLMWKFYIFLQNFSRATSVNLMGLLCDDYKSVKSCKKMQILGKM